MLQGEHSAILLTFIELPFVIMISVLSILSDRLTQILLYLDHTASFSDIGNWIPIVIAAVLCCEEVLMLSEIETQTLLLNYSKHNRRATSDPTAKHH